MPGRRHGRCSGDGSRPQPLAHQIELGDPAAATLEPLFDAPSWVTPGSLLDCVHIHSELQWEIVEDRARDTLITITSGVFESVESLLWVARPTPGDRTVAVPCAPSVVNEEPHFLGMNQRARLTVGVFDWERYDFVAAGVAPVTLLC
jgi:hypothetical protein